MIQMLGFNTRQYYTEPFTGQDHTIFTVRYIFIAVGREAAYGTFSTLPLPQSSPLTYAPYVD